MTVHVGQIYKSNDQRDHERYLRIVDVSSTHAHAQNVRWSQGEGCSEPGRVTRIRLPALGTRKQTGYTLVHDPDYVSMTLKVWGHDSEAGEKAQAFLMEAAEQIMDMGLEVSLDV